MGKRKAEAEAKKKEEEAKLREEAAARGEDVEKKDEAKEDAAPVEEETKEQQEEEEEAEEEDANDEPTVDFEKLDVFGVENILDIGGGQPLFSAFAFEDWTMMSLRVEFHLLAHSFRKDVNDPDRPGMILEHLPFYYNKYFKKALNCKLYGFEAVKELFDYVRDTVCATGSNQVIEAMLPDDLESMGIFVMLTEESRRERNRRIDLGDNTAKLKISQPPGLSTGSAPGAAVRPAAQAPGNTGMRPGISTVPVARPAMQQNMDAWPQRPMAQNFQAFQQQMQQQVRPFAQQMWRGFGR